MNCNSERTDCFKVFASNPISYGVTPADGCSLVDVQVRVNTQSMKVDSGECKVSAIAVFNVVYENDEGFFSEESSAALELNFKDDKIVDNSPVSITHNASDVGFKLNGEEYLITAIIDSEADFLSFCEGSFVADIEEGICKFQEIEAVRKITAFGEISDFDGEKDCPFEIKNMLTHEEHVRVLSCSAGMKRLNVVGEVDCEFLVVSKKGEPVRECLTIPFRYEAECDDCVPDCKVVVGCYATKAVYRVENEERRSDVSAVVTLAFNFTVFEKWGYKSIIDGFAQKNELILTRDEAVFTKDVGVREMKYKCFGEASCSKPDGYIVGVCGSKVNAFDYVLNAGKLSLTGVVAGNLIVRDKEGKITSAVAELPFACEFEFDGLPIGITCEAVKYSAKDLDGKCVAECELYFNAQYYINENITVVTNFEKGEDKKPDDCAVRIIFVEKGDDCWSVCKKAGISEFELCKQNPDLIFPAEKDSGIVIYRKL